MKQKVDLTHELLHLFNRHDKSILSYSELQMFSDEQLKELVDKEVNFIKKHRYKGDKDN